MDSFEILELDDYYVTLGINTILNKEFIIAKNGIQEDDAKFLINYILNYLNFTENEIKDNETFGCGSWMIKFVFNDLYIELHELKNVVDGKNIFVQDVSLSVKFLKEQISLNERYGAKLDFPLIGQKLAISKEIYDGSEVNAVRYEAPNNMTGWYLTSNQYNGDVNSLQVDHLYHLLKARPDLAKFLALPAGYRFFKDDVGEDVWLDKK